MWNILASDPIIFILFASGLVIAITIHEFAHAWTADKLGDPTARLQGRVTLNPLAHLDPIGTLALFLFRFGWGKPVAFDPYNLKNPLRDTALIALAGPVSNIVLATTLALISRLLPVPELVSLAIIPTIYINIVLAIFNLVPIYPLDGSKILLALLPHETAMEYDEVMHRFGTIILLALIFPWLNNSSPISLLISPPIELIAGLLIGS